MVTALKVKVMSGRLWGRNTQGYVRGEDIQSSVVRFKVYFDIIAMRIP